MDIVLVLNAVSLIFLIILVYQDIKEQMISKWVVYIFVSYSLVAGLIINSVVETFIATLPGLILLFVAYITEEKIGYGDGLVLIAIGGIAGVRSLFIICLFTFALLFFYSIGLVIGHRLRGLQTDLTRRIPFIPFIASGVVIFYGVM